jgi:N-acetylglucosaminyl-diphospho-decaprenol L-rhamnosyltransferase
VRPDVSAILVNYNAGGELALALESIRRELGTRRWEAVVVDNASIDGSDAIAERCGPPVRVIRNTDNVGFGRAVNQALAASTAPVVLIMNPDCQLVAGALTTLEAELLSHATCAIVGPRILDPDGEEQGSARGDPDMLTGLFGRASTLRRVMPWLSVSRRNVILAGAGTTDTSTVVQWLSGACMLAQREALSAVHGFDSRYFLYWEDADLCRRLRQHGYEVRYVPGATAVHRVGHSSRTARPASIRAFHESAYVYYATHVAPGAYNPKRWMARLLLMLRCWWKLRQNPVDDSRHLLRNRQA